MYSGFLAGRGASGVVCSGVAEGRDGSERREDSRPLLREENLKKRCDADDALVEEDDDEDEPLEGV